MGKVICNTQNQNKIKIYNTKTPSRYHKEKIGNLTGSKMSTAYDEAFTGGCFTSLVISET